MPWPNLLSKNRRTCAVVVFGSLALVLLLVVGTGTGLYYYYYFRSTTAISSSSSTVKLNFTRTQLQLLEQIQVEAKAAGLGAAEVAKINPRTSNDEHDDDDDICFEVGCLESALEILSGINLSANPCHPESWLDFVCKRGMKDLPQLHRLAAVVTENTKVLLEEVAATTDANDDDEFLLDEAKLLYKQCQNKTRTRSRLDDDDDDDDKSYRCVEITTRIFGLSLGKSYLNRYYYININNGSQLIESRVRALMEEIKQSYLELLESPPWMMMANLTTMEASTKALIQAKVSNITLSLVQPDWLKTDEQEEDDDDEAHPAQARRLLEQFYEGLEISRNYSFTRNFLEAIVWSLSSQKSWNDNLRDALLPRLPGGKRMELNSFNFTWNVYLGSARAGYSFPSNDVLLLAGMLQKPMFDLNRPEFMNYASLGTIIAHEIGHSLTNGSISFDKGNTSLKYWDNSMDSWDSNSLRMYKRWLNNTAQFYDSIPFQINDNLTITLNSSATLNTSINEDVADILGVRAAFRAYQKHLEGLRREGKKEKVLPGLSNFTPEQLFFMKYGIMWCAKPYPDKTDFSRIVHSPPNRRADLPLRLSSQFKTAFNCD